MKIEIRKIPREGKKFNIDFNNNRDNISFNGVIFRITNDIFKIDSNISGKIALICDLSGDEFLYEFSEELPLFLKKGIWNSLDTNKYGSYNALEIFDNYIDLDYILLSELESIRLGYHVKK